MSAVHVLKRDPDPDVVLFLEATLEKARAGEVTGVLILSKHPGGLTYAVAGIDDRFGVTGWLMHAIHKLQAD